ncbi:MAG: FHA domain-containing protein, partial [Planctomycetes bacterium]|nr:FHA domain-containing protein [Planctomycetota bacterium]
MGTGMKGYTLTYHAAGKEHVREIDQERVVLGRSPSCDVVVPEERVSREHATILREGDIWSVFDMGSANGSYINDKPIVKSVIQHGDRLMLGEIVLTFRVASQNQTNLHRVVLDEEPARRNKTAIFNMADLSLQSSVGGERRKTDSHATAWALGLFTQAAQALLSSSVLDEVLDKVMDLVFGNLPVEHGVIALYDEENGIQPRVSRSRDGSRPGTIRISQSIALEAVREGQAILVGDVFNDSKFSSEESILAMNILSAMCAPMYNEGRISGFIYVDSTQVRRPFTEEHL